MDMLNRAISLACEVHSNQFDKGGAPYILHPLRVMQKLNTSDIELMCIAVLHDVLEDSELTANDLRVKGFGFRIVNHVDMLSKKKGVNYYQYIKNLCTSEDCMRVKLADLEDNINILRLKQIRNSDVERLNKYLKAYNYLRRKLDV